MIVFELKKSLSDYALFRIIAGVVIFDYGLRVKSFYGRSKGVYCGSGFEGIGRWHLPRPYPYFEGGFMIIPLVP